MNSDEPRSLDVPLQFLDADKKYTANIYSDDPTVPTRTHVKIERLTVDRSTVLKMALPARGGQAIRLVPIAAKKERVRRRLSPSSPSRWRVSWSIPARAGP